MNTADIEATDNDIWQAVFQILDSTHLHINGMDAGAAARAATIAAMRTLAQQGYIDPDLYPEENEQQSPLEELPNGELRDHTEERANSEILTEE